MADAQSIKPFDIAALLTPEARRLQNASLSGLVGQFAGLKDVIALHAGLPPPESFPAQGFHIDLKNALPGAADDSKASVDIDTPSAVVAAQQYNFSAGYAPLLDWITRLVHAAHAPPCAVSCAVTAGAVHALSLSASLLLAPGDWLLVDEFTYSHALEVVFMPKGVRPLPVRMDDQGMDPKHLKTQYQWATAQHNTQDPAHTHTPTASPGHTQEAAHSSTQQSGASATQTHTQAGHESSDPWQLPPPRHPPRVVYLIPTGHNPTGVTMTLKRKKQIYQVCRKLDLLILEDDAYWWLYWGDEPPSHTHTTQQPHTASDTGRPSTAAHSTAAQQHGAGTHTSQPQAQQPPSAAPGVCEGSKGAADVSVCVSDWWRQLPPSFLSLDTDGRVLRVDTLAKVLGPGYRVGWVTGPALLIDKLALATQASCVGTCPLAQVMVSELLRTWGDTGWSAHLSRLRQLYQGKARALEAAVSEHLCGLTTWRGVPGAGMFMWLRLTDTDDGLPIPNDMLADALKEERVVAVPGNLSWADIPAVKEGRSCPFLRLTFAFLSEDQLREGVRRLAAALRRARKAVTKKGGGTVQTD